MQLHHVSRFVGASVIVAVINFGLNSFAFWLLINQLSPADFAHFTSAITIISTIGSFFVGLQLQAVKTASADQMHSVQGSSVLLRISVMLKSKFVVLILLVTGSITALTPFTASLVGLPVSLLAIAMVSIPIAAVTTVIDGNLYGAGMSVTVQSLSVVLTATRLMALFFGLSLDANVATLVALQLLGTVPMIGLGLKMIPFTTVHIPRRLDSSLALLSLHSIFCIVAYGIDIIMAARLLGPTVAATLIPALALARVASLTVHLAGYFSAKHYINLIDRSKKTKFKVGVHLAQVLLMVSVAVGSLIPQVRIVLVEVLGLSRESVTYFLPAMIPHTIWSMVLGSMPMRTRTIGNREVATALCITLGAIAGGIVWVDDISTLLVVTSITGLLLFFAGVRAEIRHLGSVDQSSAYELH